MTPSGESGWDRERRRFPAGADRLELDRALAGCSHSPDPGDTRTRSLTRTARGSTVGATHRRVREQFPDRPPADGTGEALHGPSERLAGCARMDTICDGAGAMVRWPNDRQRAYPGNRLRT